MRLPASLRGALYAFGLMVAASGVIWLVAREDARRVAVTCMQVHGSAAMALLVLIGAAAALHAPASWRDGKNRASGAAFAITLSLLIVTAALLYYDGDERTRSLASIVHWTVGLACIAFAGVHVWLGHRAREP